MSAFDLLIPYAHSTSSVVVNPLNTHSLTKSPHNNNNNNNNNEHDNEVLKYDYYDCENSSRFVCFASAFAVSF
jgi:hypothetical protein